MAFSYRLTLLRTLLECLGKPDERREERDQSGQKSHEINQIGHGHHLPSDGGRCPAHGTAANSINSIKAQLGMRMFVRISEDRNSLWRRNSSFAIPELVAELLPTFFELFGHAAGSV